MGAFYATDKELQGKIERRVFDLLEENVSRDFILSVYEDVCLTSGYQETETYTEGDIIICIRRNILDLIADSHH